MTILALCLAVLYFAAVGVAFLNDRRRGRNNPYAGLDDDEVSPIEPVSPVDAPRFDDRS
jgi:sec-independent protein translocase protein TatC